MYPGAMIKLNRDSSSTRIVANKHNDIITDLLLLGWHALLQTGRAETGLNCQPDDAYSSEKKDGR
jgi:hypothetical protein